MGLKKRLFRRSHISSRGPLEEGQKKISSERGGKVGKDGFFTERKKEKERGLPPRPGKNEIGGEGKGGGPREGRLFS